MWQSFPPLISVSLTTSVTRSVLNSPRRALKRPFFFVYTVQDVCLYTPNYLILYFVIFFFFFKEKTKWLF